LVAANAAEHLKGALAEKEGGWTPLVYCWRGGQRSGSFASILSQIGWRADVVEGGYKSYRRLVVKALYEDQFVGPVYLIDGNTGSAKTDILQAYAALGGQIIDLERLAGHRGSLFGGFGRGQPSQKSFESDLARQLSELDPDRPVLIEAESSKIGERLIPPSLWAAMKDAPRIAIDAPLEARAHYLTRAYADLIEDKSRLVGVIEKLRTLYSVERISGWKDMARTGAFEPLAASLMETHYDPRYRKADVRQVHSISLPDLGSADIAKAASEISNLLKRRSQKKG
jgi:tRNA 2-selenouridine synthase